MINILISNADCANPALGTFLLIAKRILQIIQIVGPIVLIVSLVINFTKGTVNPEDKKINKKVINSVIAIFVLFFIPILINMLMGALGENFTVSECWNNIDKNSGTSDEAEYKEPYDKNKKKNSKIIDDNQEYEKGDPEEENNESNESNNQEQNTENQNTEADQNKTKEDIEHKK